jgi:hypothetical protein
LRTPVIRVGLKEKLCGNDISCSSATAQAIFVKTTQTARELQKKYNGRRHKLLNFKIIVQKQ